MNRLLVHTLCMILIIGVLTAVAIYYCLILNRNLQDITDILTQSQTTSLELLDTFTTP